MNDVLFPDITHDVNPRAMSARVKGFVPANNRFQDLTPVTGAPK